MWGEGIYNLQKLFLFFTYYNIIYFYCPNICMNIFLNIFRNILMNDLNIVLRYRWIIIVNV